MSVKTSEREPEIELGLPERVGGGNSEVVGTVSIKK